MVCAVGTVLITAKIPEGNFEDMESAQDWLASFNRICSEEYPDVIIEAEILGGQHGGSIIKVFEDGVENELASEWLVDRASAEFVSFGILRL